MSPHIILNNLLYELANNKKVKEGFIAVKIDAKKGFNKDNVVLVGREEAIVK